MINSERLWKLLYTYYWFVLNSLFEVDQTTLLSAIAMICHWLTYANSAVNPVIYNFMSGKFWIERYTL